MNLRSVQALGLYIRLMLPYTLGVTLVGLAFSVVTPLARYMGSITWPLVSAVIRGAAGDLWWMILTLGFGGGLLVHRWFQRGQEPFWWNQGLPLPLRLGALWSVHGAASLVMAVLLA